MRPNRSRVDEQAPGLRHRTFDRETGKQPVPDAGFPPALDPLIDRIPIAEFLGQIPPRKPGSQTMKHGLEKIPIRKLRRCSRLLSFGGSNSRLEFLTDRVRQYATHEGHPWRAIGVA